jgi:hypothetical protein
MAKPKPEQDEKAGSYRAITAGVAARKARARYWAKRSSRTIGFAAEEPFTHE